MVCQGAENLGRSRMKGLVKKKPKNYVGKLLEVQGPPRVEDVCVPCDYSSKAPSVKEGIIPGLYKPALSANISQPLVPHTHH